MTDEVSSRAHGSDSSGSDGRPSDTPSPPYACDGRRLGPPSAPGFEGEPHGIPICCDVTGALAHLVRSGAPAWAVEAPSASGALPMLLSIQAVPASN